MPTSITIIGMGACGVAAFAELATRSPLTRATDLTVHLVERLDEMGRGLAFGTDQPGHLLNTESRLMGLHDREPGDYRRWLVDRRDRDGTPLDPDGVEYSQRSEYRQYMQSVFADALERARAAGLTVHRHHQEAVAIDGDRDGAQVVLDDGTCFASDLTLLALGTPKPDRFPDLDGRPGYFDFPWPSHRLIDGIDRDDEVVILGSSLSAIDALATLLDVEHRGRIHFVSKDGMLPRVEIPSPETDLHRRHFTLEAMHRIQRERGARFSIVDLFRLFRDEAEAATDAPIDWHAEDRIGQDAARLLQADIAAAEAGREPFQRILTSARHEASEMWDLLGPRDRARFASWLAPHFSAARFTMPIINARRIAAAIDRDQLSVHGGIDSTEWDEAAGGFVARFADGGELHAPVVVNATGTAMRLDEMPDPLIRGLADRGWLHAHPVGGIEAHRQNGAVITRDRDAPRLYAVGQLVNGVMRDTNAVWFNVACAARVVEDMFTEIAGQRE